MKRTIRKFISILLAAVMTLSMATVATAAPAPTKISIKGSLKTMYVGQTYELDSKIQPYDDVVKDKNIIWSSSNSKVLKVLKTRDDDTDVKALKAGKATITVRIKGTKLKATRTITVKAKKTTSVSSYEKKINSYNTELKAIEKKISSASVSSNYKTRKKTAQSFERQIEKIEDKLDALEDTIENKYESGKLSRSNYKSLERKIEKAEDYASRIEDKLEKKFGDYDD